MSFMVQPFIKPVNMTNVQQRQSPPSSYSSTLRPSKPTWTASPVVNCYRLYSTVLLDVFIVVVDAILSTRIVADAASSITIKRIVLLFISRGAFQSIRLSVATRDAYLTDCVRRTSANSRQSVTSRRESGPHAVSCSPDGQPMGKR